MPNIYRACRQNIFVLLLTICFLLQPLVVKTEGLSGGDTWINHSSPKIQKISSLSAAKNEFNVFSNLMCTELTYREMYDGGMRTGCFGNSSLGLIDADDQEIIPNGTDEGIRILPYTSSQIIVLWPNKQWLVSLSNTPSKGMRLGIYTRPLEVMQDERNLSGVVAKRIVAPPDLIPREPDGSALDINPQTITFSQNGEWLIAEALNGSFIRLNADNLDILHFAQAYSLPYSDRLFESQLSISAEGRYAAIYNQYASNFIVYDLQACKSLSEIDQPQHFRDCAHFDYWRFVNEKIEGIQSIRRLQFINLETLTFEATAAASQKSKGLYKLSPSANTEPLINYLALGDSYTSGEGAFDYLAATDTGLNKCHLSVKSYPYIIGMNLSGNSYSVACSGAIIKDVGSTSSRYLGQARDSLKTADYSRAQLESILGSFLPGYLPQQKFLAFYQPETASVSVGGNDIGFASILEKCVMPHIGHSSNTCYASYEDRLEIVHLIDRTIPRLISLYTELKNTSPATRFVAIGYPQIADPEGDCAVNVHLDKYELEFARDLIDYLNQSLQRAATRAYIGYVDTGRALYGHRLCEAGGNSVAVNGLTAGDDNWPIGHESYHPNALGYRLIAESIMAQTSSLSLLPSEQNSDNYLDDLLKVPVSGRAINSLEPMMAHATALRGGSVNLYIDGLEKGLLPNSNYMIRWNGATGDIIGLAWSDHESNIHTNVKIPDGVGPGSYTLNITGKNILGKTLDIFQPIFVPATDSEHREINIKIESLRVSG